MSKMNSLLDAAYSPALQAGGFMLGLVGQRGINRMLETDTMQGLLGNETATDFKRFLTPILTCAIGIGVSNYVSNDSPVKEIANGFAVSGAVNVGMELLFKRNLMADLGGGFLGGLLGADDDLDLIGYDDDDDIEGFEGEEEEEISAALPAPGVGYSLPAGRAAVARPVAQIQGVSQIM